MKHPNETGELKYYRATRIDRIRWKVLALITTIRQRYRDWDAERWYRKHGR